MSFKSLSFVAAAVLALSTGAAQAVSLANGGFETAGAGTLAASWLGSPVYAGRDCTVAHSGNCSLQLMSPAFTADGAEQNNVKDGGQAAMTLGEVATLSFWAIGTAGGTGDFKFRLAYLDGNGNIKYDSMFQARTAQINPNTWTQFTFVGAAAPEAGLAAFVQFIQPIGPIGIGPAGENWFAGNVHVDDVSLGVAAVPEPGTYALLLAGMAGVGAVVRRRRAV